MSGLFPPSEGKIDWYSLSLWMAMLLQVASVNSFPETALVISCPEVSLEGRV